MGRKMVKYLFLAGLILLAGCKCHPEKTPDSGEGDCFNNGNLQIKMTQEGKGNPTGYVRNVKISRDGKLVIWIKQYLLRTVCLCYSDSKLEKVISYNIWGDQIAECTFQEDHHPVEGTVWTLVWEGFALKRSIITTYHDGKEISKSPYAEEEMSEVLKQLKTIWFKHLPEREKHFKSVSP